MSIEEQKFSKKNPYIYLILSFITVYGLLLSADILMLFYEEIFFKLIIKTDYTKTMVELSGFIFITITALLWARKKDKLSWETLGFIKKNWLLEILKGWIFGALILKVCVIIMMMFSVVTIDKVNINANLLLKLIPLVFLWTIQGHAEEVLARSLFFGRVAKNVNVFMAIISSALFFTLMHLGNDGLAFLPLFDLFIFGVFAALLMIKTKNIWVVSGFHAAWNCFQGNIFGFAVSGTKVGEAVIEVGTHGPDYLSGGQFGVEGSIISVVVQSILIFMLAYDLFIKQNIKLNDKFDLENEV